MSHTPLPKDGRALVGVVHVGALPGTPRHRRSLEALIEEAVREARIYRTAGFSAVMIENMHDRPYLRRGVGPEIVASMTAIGRAVAGAIDLPLGVQILAGANEASLAVAVACGAAFVRAEGYVFGHVADEGWIDADAGTLQRYRRAIGASDVLIFADVKKKHSAHAITADVDIAETAHAAEFFLADGVVITGAATGLPASAPEVDEVSAAVKLPVWVGSGITPGNIAEFAAADGFIVGSYLKRQGRWDRGVDPARAVRLAKAFRHLPRPTRRG